MALTEAGTLYLEGARQALMHLQLVTEEVEQLQHELRGTLRITAPPSFGPAFLNQVCCRFMREHPQVRLEVNLNDANDDLIDGGYDLSLRDGPTDQPELIAQPLIENRVILCASPSTWPAGATRSPWKTTPSTTGCCCATRCSTAASGGSSVTASRCACASPRLGW
jgi:DNA-binding transcriptional LysR family regulator